MIFEEALKELKNGKKIRRKEWRSGDYWVIKNDEIVKECNETEISKICYIFYTQLLENDWEIYQEPILDEEEKKYLSQVIKPFRDRVDFVILKKSACVAQSGFIYIILDNNKNDLSLPYFELGKMYKKMQVNKRYTLKELGL